MKLNCIRPPRRCVFLRDKHHCNLRLTADNVLYNFPPGCPFPFVKVNCVLEYDARPESITATFRIRCQLSQCPSRSACDLRRTWLVYTSPYIIFSFLYCDASASYRMRSHSSPNVHTHPSGHVTYLLNRREMPIGPQSPSNSFIHVKQLLLIFCLILF